MRKQNGSKKPALTLVGTGDVVPASGTERKRRRLAATIVSPEPERPRLPVGDDTATILSSDAWRKRWGGIRPVAETTAVYIAGCTGSMALSGLLGFPIFKVGTALDVPARSRKLNSERYGSVVIADLAVHDEPGWSDWEPAKLSARATHPASPVRVLARSLLIELPFWVTAADFEALLVAALEPVSLVGLAATPAGRALARRRGCSADVMLRFSRGRRGPVLATEISAMAPSGDGSRLIALIERMLIRLVLADGGER